METERDGGYFFVGDRFLAPTSLSDSETDDADDGFEVAGDVESFSDDEPYDMPDTSAAQAAEGKDIQNIPWGRLGVSRERFRKDRLKNYANYLNLHATLPEERLKAECKSVSTGYTFFDFYRNTRSVKPNIVHFQLRNLVASTSKHDVYINSAHSILHYNALTRRSTTVLDMSGRTGSVSAGWGHMQVCNISVKRGLLVAGGFYGDLVVHNLHSPDTTATYRRVSHSDNGITNGIDIFESASGVTSIVTSNNDAKVRFFDAETVQQHTCYPLSWAVNFSAVSPVDSKVMCVVGDDRDAALLDVASGKEIAPLKGHIDYSFAAAWHPAGNVVATGNQDATTRLWDVRNTVTSFATLKGRLGAVRSLSFSADGRHLMMAEPADFVHVFDVASEYERCQEIDLFGEIAGCGFSPDGNAAFVGVSDARYASLLQFDRRSADFATL